MYSVSQDYLDALDLPVRTYKLAGTIGGVSFDESNILSIEISNQVSEGSEIKLGSVYIGELTASFYGVTGIARGSWVGKKIILSEGLMLADNSFEYVPLGVYTIAEANHTQEGVDVVAYDAMTAFDKARNDLTETGTAYDFLSLMCQKCGVTLGMTSADVAALTNGTETLSIYSENDIETWRDLLSWVAQTLCSVATINRAGELELRQYSVSSAATIDETHRFTGCSFSDFTTYYTGMSVVNIALRQTEYKSVTPDDGLTYNLGSNPLVQGDYELVQNIIDEFSDVQLVPFSAQMLGGAIYDLCDCLTFSGGIAAGAVCGVMGYTWKYNGAYAVNGFGSNPALATAKSKAQKDIDAIYNTIGEEINQMSVVQNSSAVTCGENTETSILTYNFEVTQEENTTMADVSVVMTSSASETEVGDVYTLSDIVAHLSFYVDGSEVNVYAPEFIVDEGKDTMTFNFSLSGLSVGAHQFDVRLTMDGGSGSIAAGNVHEMLWGYGITFEVYMKELEVSSLPDQQLFFVGQSLDYDGLTVDGVYNNGLRDDVTSLCEYYPTEGTVLSEYDVGTIAVNVTYNDLYTEFEIDVKQAYLVLTYPLHEVDHSSYIPNGITTYNGDIIHISEDGDYPSYSGVRNYKITPYANGRLEYELIGSHDFPTYPTSANVSFDYVQIGTKRIQTAGIGIMRSSVVQPFYYYDFEDGSNGTLNVSFVHVGSSSTIVRFGNYDTDYSYNCREVDGCILWPYVTMTDSDGNSYSGYAVGQLSGTDLTIYCHDNSPFYGSNWVRYTTDHTGSDVWYGARSRPQLEHFTEQKYTYNISGDSEKSSYSLYEVTCDGTSATKTLIWSGEGNSITTGTASRRYIYGIYIPSGKKFILATYWTTDFDAFVVDLDTLESEHHYASSIYGDTLAQIASNGYQPIYVPSLQRYVAISGGSYSTTTTMYLSEDLIYWSTVENIENNYGGTGSAAYPYVPTDYGILAGAYTGQTVSGVYLSHLIFDKVE